MYEDFNDFTIHTQTPDTLNVADSGLYHGAMSENEDFTSLSLCNSGIKMAGFHCDMNCMDSTSLIHPNWDKELAYSNITPEAIHDISERIMHTFGTSGMQIEQAPGLFNAGVSVGDSQLVYDQNFLWSIGEQYGTDAIGGIIAHEIGHQVVNDLYSNSDTHITHWQQELCADYISGITSQLNGLSPDAMHHFYSGFDIAEGGIDHPVGGLRSEAFDKGVEWASNHTNAVFSEFLLQNPSNLNDMLEQNIFSIFPDSAEAYVSMGDNMHLVGEHTATDPFFLGKDNPPPPPPPPPPPHDPTSESSVLAAFEVGSYHNSTHNEVLQHDVIHTFPDDTETHIITSNIDSINGIHSDAIGFFRGKDNPLPPPLKGPTEVTSILATYQKLSPDMHLNDVSFGSSGERDKLEHELSIAKDRFNSANSALETLERNKANGISGVDSSIKDRQNEIASATTQINDINYKLSSLKD